MQKKSSSLEIAAVVVVAVLLLGLIFTVGSLLMPKSTLQVVVQGSQSTNVIAPSTTQIAASPTHPTATNTREPTNTPVPPTNTREPTNTPEPTIDLPIEPEISDITLAQYNQLRDGMSYAKVVKILGRGGGEVSSNAIGGIRTVMYQWTNSGYSNMNAMFQNDKLVMKAQFGLE